MVKILEEFPGVHMTFNFVPLLAEQIEEYASGNFKESWFEIAFAKTETLTVEQKREIIERAFQVNDIYVQRWPRYAELRSQVQSAGPEASVAHFSVRDWRDLQVLSQLAWTDEEYFVADAAMASLSEKGKNYTAADSALAAGAPAETPAGGLARISSRSGARPDRNLDDALLPSDSSAALRYRHRASFKPAYAVAASCVPPSGGCERAIASLAKISRARIRQATCGTLAIGGFRLRPDSRNRHGTRLQVVRDRRRSFGPHSKCRILARSLRLSRKWAGALHPVAFPPRKKRR